MEHEDGDALTTAEHTEAHGVDLRWLSIARTDLQKGIMAAVRAIAKPGGF
jgi:hypothetical protein